MKTMTHTNIIQFNPIDRVLNKVDKFLESKELFFEDRESAIPLLLTALKYADNALKQKIILLLGSSAKQEIAWPLYKMLSDPLENEEIRYIAAIQLRVISPTLKDAQPLIDRLLQDLENKDPEMRMYAASALGWNGNFQAAIPLIALLFDSDMDVMQAAVNSLTDLGDDRIFIILIDRLKYGSLDQKRCILFNLWHLTSKQDEVIEVYMEYLNHSNAELRYDSLVLLRALTEPEECLSAYIECLNDDDSRIRLLALECIGEADKNQIVDFKKKIAAMYADPDLDVQAAAKKIMSQL
jgi:HEAT repeat protein